MNGGFNDTMGLMPLLFETDRTCDLLSPFSSAHLQLDSLRSSTMNDRYIFLLTDLPLFNTLISLNNGFNDMYIKNVT